MNGSAQRDWNGEAREDPEGPRPRSVSGTPKVVRLGEFRVDLETWEISRNGHRERLREKPFRVLEALAERPGELITRSELQQRLWPDGTVVDFDNNLNTAVASLRTTLGDTAKAPWLIETLPRLGYRLIAEVRFDDTGEARPGAPIEATPSSPVASPERLDTLPRGMARRRSHRWLALGTVVVLGVLMAAVRPRLVGPGESSSGQPARPGIVPEVAPDDSAARQSWQQGHYLLARGSAGDLTQALESFEEARRLEPRLAPIHAAIAETLVRTSFAGGLELRDGLSQAREAARRTLDLDPRSVDGLRILALADLHLEWDFEAAGAGLESALRLDPGDAQVHLAAATFLSAAGANDAAVRAARRAVELDPASTLLRADLGFFLLAAGRYPEALELSEQLAELEPESIHVLGTLVLAAERLGLFDKAVAAAQQILELRGADEGEVRALDEGETRNSLIHYRRWRLANFRASGEPSPFRLSVHLAGLREREAALAGLREAHRQRDPWMVYLHSFDAFADLRDDSEFRTFVHQLGFPQPADDLVSRIADRF